MGTLVGEEQARLLEDALAVVRQQTSMMKRCLEAPGKLMDALKCCSTLVSELRTSVLSPKQYYELYMAVFDALRFLAVYLRDSHPVNHLADLYELVQYAGNIIPRLYLMITVGTVYMAIPDAPVKEIMKDMMEMSRGVQHPMRGLFLRYYLSGQARDFMPTTPPSKAAEDEEATESNDAAQNGDEKQDAEDEDPQGTLQDSISFTLTNFVEMNKLWVRLQHLGHSREREQRLKERKELQLLVGSNLVRLSQLVDLETYKSSILGPLLEQVVQCRDVLAQEYLLEVITQVFPDEYHLHTLDEFLSAMPRLNPHVNIKNIVIGLMDRLSKYAARDPDTSTTASSDRAKLESDAVASLVEKLSLEQSEKPAPASDPATEESKDVPTDEKVNGDTSAVKQSEDEDSSSSKIPSSIKLFEIFFEQVASLANVQHLPIQDITALLVSLVNLALNVYPSRLDYVDQVYQFATEKTKQFANSADLHSQITQHNVLQLLLAPVKAYVKIFTALALPGFIPLLQAQSYPTKKALASEIARSIVSNQTLVVSTADLEKVLEVIRVLIGSGQQVQPVGARRGGLDSEEQAEEQALLSKIVHMCQSPDNSTQLKLLQVIRRAYGEGKDQIRHTFPALVNAALRLARRLKTREHYDDGWKTQSQTLYKLVHEMVTSLYEKASSSTTNVSSIAELAMRLFLAAGQVADQTGFEEVSYEFFAQAFTVYEESISDSRAQYQAVCCIASALYQTENFSKDNYDTLITKSALYSSKLLKKPDQCRAVCAVSHLWWVVSTAEVAQDEQPKGLKEGKRVLECLQRALRVADACMDAAASVELFVEILGQYVYYYDQENEAVTTKYINGLIELIHSNLASATPDQQSAMDQPRKHFQRTLEYIDSRAYEGVITAAKS